MRRSLQHQTSHHKRRCVRKGQNGLRVLRNLPTFPQRREVLQQKEAHGAGVLLQNPLSPRKSPPITGRLGSRRFLGTAGIAGNDSRCGPGEHRLFSRNLAASRG